MRKHPILGDIRPYNFISPEGREVTAWMSVERDHRLGALLIEAVDGNEMGQIMAEQGADQPGGADIY